MPEWLSSIINALKHGLPVYLAAAGTGLIYLLLPPAAIEWLGAKNIDKDYRWAFGLALVFFGLLSVFSIITWVRTTRAGHDALDSLMGFVTSHLVRRQFDKLNAREKYLILRVVESHEDVFFYPRHAATIQSLADKGWVNFELFEYEGKGRFRIRWDKWLALNRIRAHVRAERERFTDADKDEIQQVIKALD